MHFFRRLFHLDSAPSASESAPQKRRLPIRQVFFHVTKACNLHCSYCYFSARNPLPDELATHEFATLWPQLVSLAPSKVIFTGGEPLLRGDILQLLRGLQDADPTHRVQRCLNTNGHLVTLQLARTLVGLADEVRVSLDALSHRNDALRGAGNFKAALQAIDTLYSVGFEPKVLVTLTSVSAPDLEELICLLLERGITRININEFRPIGRGAAYHEWRADLYDAHKAVQAARLRSGVDLRGQIPSLDTSDTSRRTCGVGQFLNIMPNGDVFPCHVLTQQEFRCGNIRERSLLDICQERELLGELQRLDFRQVAAENDELKSLTRSEVCMGSVYSAESASAGWRKHLALFQSGSPATRCR